MGITGLDTRSLTNFIRDKGAPKGTISNSNKGIFNLKKLTNSSIKWPGLNGLDLAKIVTTKKNIYGKVLKLGKKKEVLKKIKRKNTRLLQLIMELKKIF